jgi:hypothetical protein
VLIQLDKDSHDGQALYEQILVKFGETPGTDSEEVFGYFKAFVDKFVEVNEKLNQPKKVKTESV